MTYEQYTEGNGSVAGRSAERIQSDLQDIRGEIQRTLEALSGQLQPGQLLQQAFNAIRGGRGGWRYWQNLLRSIEENPLPLALMGAGFGYLIYSDAQRRRHPVEYHVVAELEEQEEQIVAPTEEEAPAEEEPKKTGRELRTRAHEVGESVRGRLESTRGKMRDARTATRSKMHEARTATQDELRQMGTRAREATEKGRTLIHEQPMILAGLGLALGAAFAATAPMSRKEHEVLGPAEEALEGRARKVAHKVVEKTKSVSHEVIETAKQETLGEKDQPSEGTSEEV